jgi:ABC-type sulfate transport system substrate-binding protein
MSDLSSASTSPSKASSSEYSIPCYSIERMERMERGREEWGDIVREDVCDIMCTTRTSVSVRVRDKECMKREEMKVRERRDEQRRKGGSGGMPSETTVRNKPIRR